jgi:hypothetical protein
VAAALAAVEVAAVAVEVAAVVAVAAVVVAAGGVRRLRAKPDKKFVDGQAAMPSW